MIALDALAMAVLTAIVTWSGRYPDLRQ
ncbi:hypothetical protein SMD44_06056 [Streptomyces alboflavus]|uniref:Uncharacterized protein n=1 Tax=Streptomyces alboflavus TaxID=67267 RepID=A0A1Z1WJG5_9ACTN|nr:hypothetical protein SMD44_06056 [Streptomyces alboflavus]